MRSSIGGVLSRARGIGMVRASAEEEAASETQYLRPTSNINTLWANNLYSSIDDAVVQPAVTPSDGNTVNADKNDDNEEQIWGMATGDAGSYSKLKVWLLGVDQSGATSPQLQVRLKINGEWTDAQSLTQFSDNVVFEWESLEFDGPFTLPLSELQLGVSTGTMNDGNVDQITLQAAYIEAVPA